MSQSYDVHIDGKQFSIVERADIVALPRNWLALRIDSAEDMDAAKQALQREPDLRGVQAFGDDPAQLWAWFRRGFRLVQAAGGVVSDEQGRLLAIHRLGRWDLPKGKVEANEELEAAAIREVQEECGMSRLRIMAPLCETWHTYPRNGEQHLKCTHWFLMQGSSQVKLVPQAEEDIDAAQWLDADGVARMREDTYPSLLPVLSAWEKASRDRG